MKKIRSILITIILLIGGISAFSQDAMGRRGSIPEELLRPRREEAARYPIDMVIGPLGQGQASEEAYETARKAAKALLEGNMNAPILASVNKVFLESCLNMLDTITPRYFRLGSGREEPDGSFSFLVRFAGREEGITGELYVRLEEQRRTPPRETPPPQEAAPPPPVIDSASEEALESAEEVEAETEVNPEEEAAAQPVEVTQTPQETPPPPPEEPPVKVWVFEDLILEEARSREAENGESLHRFDFPPYERFF